MQLTPTQRRALAWLGIAAVVVLALRALGAVLTPFVVAGVLAYALTPVVDRLDDVGNGRMPRWLAVTLVELTFIFAVLCILLLVVPVLAKEIPLMRQQVPVLFERLHTTLSPWLAQFGIHVALDVDSLRTQLLKYLSAANWEDAFPSLWSSVKLGGSVALALVGNAVLIPVALFYLLMDWKPFVARMVELVPPRMRPGVDSFAGEADAVLGQYLRGQLLVMLIMAIYYSTGLGLFGLDLALPIGVFTGLAMFVPYVGFGIGLILALLAGFLQFASVKALVMVGVVYGSGQVIEGFFITPRFVGERIGLHPLAVIFALLAFAQVFGFVGVLVALPASAVLLVAIRRARAHYMASSLYQASQ
jgi:predicted PurR-regulated permease PerM